jgi:hypothetical protein
VNRLLKEGIWNAVVVHAKIRDAGYSGGISILSDYIRPRRVLRQGEV